MSHQYLTENFPTLKRLALPRVRDRDGERKTAFDQPKRIRCRNQRCRSKLPVPTDNHHHAFCSKYCFEQFYQWRCKVCEDPILKGKRRKSPDHCRNSYEITFAKGQVPPVHGFWSLTLYNDLHLFNPNALKRYSLGTKNKNLKLNADGSLTLYAGAKSPGKDKENNWLPAPAGTFSLYIRAYWPEKAVLDDTWMPPVVKIAN